MKRSEIEIEGEQSADTTPPEFSISVTEIANEEATAIKNDPNTVVVGESVRQGQTPLAALLQTRINELLGEGEQPSDNKNRSNL